MTDGNPRPDDDLTPPASTGWSEHASSGDDDELAPPFVPGGASPAAEPEAPAEPVPAEPAAEPAPEPETAPEGEDSLPFEGGWSEEGGEEAGTETEDDFPFDAFDIEADDSGEHADEDAGEPADATEPARSVVADGPGTAAHELADTLEDMARRLRERGAEAAEAQMAAPDRFTALLAGLLAGYLAGRE